MTEHSAAGFGTAGSLATTDENIVTDPRIVDIATASWIRALHHRKSILLRTHYHYALDRVGGSALEPPIRFAPAVVTAIFTESASLVLQTIQPDLIAHAFDFGIAAACSILTVLNLIPDELRTGIDDILIIVYSSLQ